MRKLLQPVGDAYGRVGPGAVSVIGSSDLDIMIEQARKTRAASRELADRVALACRAAEAVRAAGSEGDTNVPPEWAS